jgi:2-isopropylmalate synthase
MKQQVCRPLPCQSCKELSQFVDEIANVRHNPRQPWVGQTAFAHKGGMHVNAGDRRWRAATSTLIRRGGQPAARAGQRPGGPEQHRNEGARNWAFKLDERYAGVEDHPGAHQGRLEHEGYEFEAAEASLALLISRELQHTKLPFSVDGYHVSMRRDGAGSICEATVKVRVGAEAGHTVAEGDGPVNALDQALARGAG